MTTAGSESVYDRLSRKQTAASIGQRAAAGVTATTTTTSSRSKVSARSSTATLSRPPTLAQRMTTDMRMSMLDELEVVEQTWPDGNGEMAVEFADDTEDTLLDELMLESSKELPVSAPQKRVQTFAPLRNISTRPSAKRPAAASKPAAKSKSIDDAEPKPAVSKAMNPGLSVFERLHQQETKASVGQQVESIRQKTMLKMQAISSMSKPKSTMIAKPSMPSKRISSANTAGTQTTCDSTAGGTEVNGGKAVTPRRHRPWNATSQSKVKTSGGNPTPERTPDTIYAAFSDDSSASTVSSLVGVDESPTTKSTEHDHKTDASTEVPRKDSALDFLFLPKSSSTGNLGPWKMALTRKVEVKGEEGAQQQFVAPPVEPLYLRSMANVLNAFASGNASEVAVATELITALFRRDFECGKYWTEEEADAVPNDEKGGEYHVEKAAESSSTRGGPTTRTVSSAFVTFDYDKRMVTVLEYHHGIQTAH